VPFLIAAIFTVKKGISGKKNDDSSFLPPVRKAAKVWAIASAIFTAIGSAVAVPSSIFGLDHNFDPYKLVNFSVTKKVDSESDSLSTIYFNLSNSFKVDITYITGKMDFYDRDILISTWDVTFNNTYPSKSTKQSYVEFNNYSIHDTEFTRLKITYKITAMTLNGKYSSESIDLSKETIVIKSAY
jgi:hypothetical protein